MEWGWGGAQCREAGKPVLTLSHAEDQLPFEEARGRAGLTGSLRERPRGMCFLFLSVWGGGGEGTQPETQPRLEEAACGLQWGEPVFHLLPIQTALEGEIWIQTLTPLLLASLSGPLFIFMYSTNKHLLRPVTSTM